VAVATDDVIQIREFATGQWLRNIPFASTWHSPFLTSPSDDRIATLAGPPGILTVWDLHSGEQLAQMSHGARVTSLDWSPDGQWLASGGLDSVIRIFDPGTGEELRALPTTAPVTALAVSPDGRTLAAGLQDNGIHLLDASTGAIIRRLRGADGFVNRLSFSPDGRKLASSNQTWAVSAGTIASGVWIPTKARWI
jgi:WD40 repeat protein